MFSLVFGRKHQSSKVNLCICSYCLYKHMLHEQACWLAVAHQKAWSKIKLSSNNLTFLTWTSALCNLTSLNNMSQLYSFHVIVNPLSVSFTWKFLDQRYPFFKLLISNRILLKSNYSMLQQYLHHEHWRAEPMPIDELCIFRTVWRCFGWE